MNAPLIILEGPDGVGKTTLGKFLAKELHGAFWHMTSSRTLFGAMHDYQQNALDNARVNITELERPVVIDRHWPSELIYGTVFRPGNPHGFQHETLEKQIEEMCGIYVFCWHDDVVARHREDKDPDHPYDDDSFTQVCNMYRQFFAKYRAVKENWIDYSIPLYGNNLHDFAAMIRVKHHELNTRRQ